MLLSKIDYENLSIELKLTYNLYLYHYNSISNIDVDFSHFKDIKDGVLYYPCSRYDIVHPYLIFKNQINNFIFCDKYLKMIDFEKLFEGTIKSKIEDNYSIRNKRIRYNYSKNQNNINNLVLEKVIIFNHKTEDLNFFIDSEKTITQRQGNGYNGLLTLDSNIDIFFYRRDSCDGGSCCNWLRKPSLNAVLYKLNDTGFIVTDGSNLRKSSFVFGDNFEYFHNYMKIKKDNSIEKMVKLDKYGNAYELVGRITEGYGPTLVWKVTKAKNLHQNQLFINDFNNGFERFTHLKAEATIEESINKLKSYYTNI